MIDTPQLHRPLPFWKRCLFRLVAIGLAVGFLELAAAALWLFTDAQTDWQEVRLFQQALIERAERPEETTEAIHPYLGWVFDPQSMPRANVAGGDRPVNPLGFVDDGPTILHRDPNTVIVGITGGSVALHLSWLSENVLRERLEAHPDFAGKQIRFVRLAMGGYKQPQQLMALNYLLSLGGELDYLINIDGYNEMVLAVDDNYSAATFMPYPRLWHHRLQDLVDPRMTSVSYQLLSSRARRQWAASVVNKSWLRHSWTANYVWLRYDTLTQHRQNELADQLRTHQRGKGRAFAKAGPPNNLAHRDAAITEAIGVWTRCSSQLDRLCRANGIRYLHALQPNQYHANSKPLSAEERQQFYSLDMPAATVIRDAYPLAIIAGQKLRDAGVPFHNMTQLFAAETDTIYIDGFCHYNQRGNDLLAAAIAEALMAAP